MVFQKKQSTLNLLKSICKKLGIIKITQRYTKLSTDILKVLQIKRFTQINVF